MVEKDYETAVTNFIENSEEAKEDLKASIISENSKDFYYKLIGEEIEKIKSFKDTGDKFFGVDNYRFRINYISSIYETYEGNPLAQLYNMCISDIALDVFL